VDETAQKREREREREKADSYCSRIRLQRLRRVAVDMEKYQIAIAGEPVNGSLPSGVLVYKLC
jgi:hypothetical protein